MTIRYKRQSHDLKTKYYYQRKSKSFSIINKRPKSKPLIYHVYTFIAHSGENSHHHSLHQLHFDTHSIKIGVDNRTSYNMTPSVHNLISPIISVNNLYIQDIGERL